MISVSALSVALDLNFCFCFFLSVFGSVFVLLFIVVLQSS